MLESLTSFLAANPDGVSVQLYRAIHEPVHSGDGTKMLQSHVTLRSVADLARLSPEQSAFALEQLQLLCAYSVANHIACSKPVNQTSV